ncbi:MAG: FHA domain-containing protein [Myxococcota bacterium]
MRECLGWVTNCADDKRCPQNWLEYAVTELPGRVRCHVCDRDVDMVTSEEAFDAAVEARRTTALPVVPPAGAPAIYGRFGGAPLAGSGGGGGGGVGAASVPSPAVPSGNKPKTEPPKTFYCLLATGESIKIDKEQMVIGRSRTCDIVIASAKVSRQHASVTRGDNEVFIEDLGSANGVWRNGERLAGKTKIANGDVFTISEETLTFELR